MIKTTNVRSDVNNIMHAQIESEKIRVKGLKTLPINVSTKVEYYELAFSLDYKKREQIGELEGPG